MAKKTRANKGKRPIVIGISGASGVIYGIRTIQVLHELGYPVYAIVSSSAKKVCKIENEFDINEEIVKYTSFIYSDKDLDASTSSSSFTVLTKGMIIIPCSIKTMALIASGVTSTLISRTAINFLRTKGKLVLVIRETPLGSIELKNALTISRSGGIILPASPGFYSKPKTIQDMIDFIVGKALDMVGIDHRIYKRWSKSDQDLSSQAS
ncbi:MULTISPECIES: UbiX family flavin prenyltransferase [Acidianus]|nr:MULTISPECIES: UbiX family flavin prenyltransferase [Acidianus]NON62205.1 UbiX family flavin prenyltransferase [Acidianus sp. RZ1]